MRQKEALKKILQGSNAQSPASENEQEFNEQVYWAMARMLKKTKRKTVDIQGIHSSHSSGGRGARRTGREKPKGRLLPDNESSGKPDEKGAPVATRSHRELSIPGDRYPISRSKDPMLEERSRRKAQDFRAQSL